MDMRTQDVQWLRMKLDVLARTGGDAFACALPPEGKAAQVRSIVAAFADIVRYRVDKLGGLEDGDAPLRRDHAQEFSIVRHGVFPVIASLLLLLPIYAQVWPVPAYPINLVPYILVAWVVIGVVYMYYITRQRPDVLDAMGRVWVDDQRPGVPGVAAGATSPTRT